MKRTLYKDYTRELDGVPVTECLSYIYLTNSLYYTNLAYFKGICILHTVDMWYNLIILETSMMFFVIYDYMIVTCDKYIVLY